VTAPAPPGGARTTVEFPAGEQFRSVPRLVLGGVASRFELPIDRVDDLLLAVESLLMQETVGGTLRLEAEATPSGLLVRLGSFRPGQLDDPGLRRVLTPLVESVDEQRDGDFARIELVVSATYRPDEA
jgi:hypothetical protein